MMNFFNAYLFIGLIWNAWLFWYGVDDAFRAAVESMARDHGLSYRVMFAGFMLVGLLLWPWIVYRVFRRFL